MLINKIGKRYTKKYPDRSQPVIRIQCALNVKSTRYVYVFFFYFFISTITVEIYRRIY